MSAGADAPRGRPRRPRPVLTVARVLDVATDRYGIVLMLIIATYVLSSALPSDAGFQVLLTALQGATAVVALAASEVSPRHRRRAAQLAGVAVVVAALSTVAGVEIASFISAILLGAALVAIIVRIASHVQITAQTLLGAICTYVLFGLIYAFIYGGVGRVSGGNFLSPAGNHTQSDYLFFSFTTLTTTGYGDLIPSTGLGRALAMLEALMGQLYLVTVLARLVALWIPQRRFTSRRGDGAEESRASDTGTPSALPEP